MMPKINTKSLLGLFSCGAVAIFLFVGWTYFGRGDEVIAKQVLFDDKTDHPTHILHTLINNFGKSNTIDITNSTLNNNTQRDGIPKIPIGDSTKDTTRTTTSTTTRTTESESIENDTNITFYDIITPKDLIIANLNKTDQCQDLTSIPVNYSALLNLSSSSSQSNSNSNINSNRKYAQIEYLSDVDQRVCLIPPLNRINNRNKLKQYNYYYQRPFTKYGDSMKLANNFKFYLYLDFDKLFYEYLSHVWSIFEHERFDYLKYHPNRVLNINEATIIIFPHKFERQVEEHYPCYGCFGCAFVTPFIPQNILENNIELRKNIDNMKKENITLFEIGLKENIDINPNGNSNRIINAIQWRLKYKHANSSAYHSKRRIWNNNGWYMSKFIKYTIMELHVQYPQLYFAIFSVAAPQQMFTKGIKDYKEKYSQNRTKLDIVKHIKVSQIASKIIRCGVIRPKKLRPKLDIILPPPFVSGPTRNTYVIEKSFEECDACRKRKYSITFYGVFTSHWIRKHWLRMYDKYEEFNQLIISRYARDNRKEYQSISYDSSIVDTSFVLCPRGTLSYSFRFRETLESGNIIIMIANNYILPFSNFINWEYFQQQKAFISIEERLWQTLSNQTQLTGAKANIQQIFFGKMLTDEELCNAHRHSALLRDKYFGRPENEMNTMLLNMQHNIRMAENELGN